jgi:protein involved in polysaccharide export with SLBB domain
MISKIADSRGNVSCKKEDSLKNILLFLAILFLMHIPLSAQEQSPSEIYNEIQNRKPQNSVDRFYQLRSVTRTTDPQVLEGVLDEIGYKLGPGDVLQISTWGDLENQFEVMVNPQGTILIPTVGEIAVAGKSLPEGRSRITEKIWQKYKKSEISVNLAELRKFRVYLTGEVKNPGTYFAQASDRLSDIIEIAQGMSEWANETAVELRHREGTMTTADLSGFYRDGHKAANPYLQSGDLVHVPAIDLNAEFVVIEGNVGFQGIYTLKQNETMIAFLRRVGALTKSSDLANIVLIRNGEKTAVNLLDDNSGDGAMQLQSRDNIMLPTIVTHVYVRGEVLAPGALPYLANYSAKEYVGAAGALDSAVEPSDYYVIRNQTGEIVMGPDVIVERGDMVVVPQRGRETFKDYMTIFAPIISLTVAVLALILK